jgi:hypothetical protein
MAQTKRKRRSKHRGTAAGTIESRGRTGRKPNAEELKKAQREDARTRRMSKPPTWRSAFIKASVMAAVLFGLMQLGVLGGNATVASSLFLALFAILLYTPAAYATDRFVYNRNQRKLQQR